MGTFVTLLIVLALLCLILLVWLVLTFLSKRRVEKILAQREAFWMDRMATERLSWLTQLSQLQSGPLALVDKAMALVGTSDPLSFQQVQAMSPSTGYDERDFDPSEEAEMERIRERESALVSREDDLNGIELDALSELGISPEFFRANPPTE